MNNWRPDLVSLRLFVAVCEEASISKAAEREAIAPSAVSKRIAEIEDATGVQLLIRGNRGVIPTNAGQSLLHHARQMLHSARRAQAELSEYAKNVRGHVRVFANISSMAEFLPRDIASFLRANDSIRVDLQERVSSEVVQGVRSGTVELGICLRIPEISTLETFEYGTDRLVLVCHASHPLARRGRIRFEEAMDCDFVAIQSDSRVVSQLAQAAAKLGRNLNYRMYVGTFDAACHLISENLAVGIFAHAAVQLQTRMLALSTVELDEPWAQREVILCTDNYANLSGPARAFADHLRQCAQNRIAAGRT